MESNRATEIKVGIFLVVSLTLGVMVIFLIGSAKQMFDKQAALHSTFGNVAGLRVGSPVLLAGLKIGVVDEISFGKSPTDKNIHIRMNVLESVLERIRQDSVAIIQGKGLLGDSQVVITIGITGKPIPSGGNVKGETPKGLSDFMAEGGEIITKLKTSLDSIDTILKQYNDQKMSNDIKQLIASLSGLFQRARKGPGLLYDLIYSRTLASRLQGAIHQVHRTTVNLSGISDNLQQIIRRVRTQQGTVIYRLLFSKKDGQLVSQINGAIGDVRRTIRSLNDVLAVSQRKNTLLYDILYSKTHGKLLANLTVASKDLRNIMNDIRRGRGTLGAIINDPTAYEDFKTILGQVKRSRVFKGLIRFIIQRDDREKGGQMKRD